MEQREEDEMPLLFMEGLPPDFQHNAQLSAIASFMADSDDEGEAPSDDRAGKTRRGQKRSESRSRERRRQQPYARPAREAAGAKTPKVVPKKQQADATKELQLYLSLFHV